MPIQKISTAYYKQLADPITGIYRKIRCTDGATEVDCANKTEEVYKNVTLKSRNELTRRSANTNIEQTYYTSLSDYRRARCKTIHQSQYRYGVDANGKATNNCETEACNVVYYKPNNNTFSQDGAVSSGSRLQRLKYNSITTSANLSSTAPRYRTTLSLQQPFNPVNTTSQQTQSTLKRLRQNSTVYCDNCA